MKKYLVQIFSCALLLAACNSGKITNSAGNRLDGEFSYRADVALFYVCSQQKRYPVKGNDAYLSMERAYLRLSNREPGSPVFSNIEGHFAEGPKAEGNGTETYLVVDRFIKFEEGKSCQE